MGERVGQDIATFFNKEVREGRVTVYLVVQHFLEGHHVVDQNLVGGLECHHMGQIFGLG